MRKNKLQSVLCGFVGIAVVLSPVDAATPKKAATPTKQVVTGPVAQYWVDTATSSGLSLGGGKPSMSSIMGMMGGGDNIHHSLYLRLGSTQAASGEAAADHLPPAGLGAGANLPLYYQAGKPVKRDYTPGTPGETGDRDTPKGKILIYWGCGAHAPANQPLIIDLAKITDPAQRQTMALAMFKPVTLDTVRPPTPATFKTYGEWPNSKSTKDIKGSLVGGHVIKGNYSPQIDFNLSQTQDFMAPIDVTGNVTDATGATRLDWTAISGAKGIVATAVGGGQQNGETVVVMWTSAQIQTGWMGMAPDYLTANDIDRLLASKALLPGEITTCTVPSEVGKAVQGAIYGITAYGGEANFAYPPRPADVKTPWNIQWETKVRYRSTTGGVLGQDMGGMMGARQGDNTQSSDAKKKKKKGFSLGDMVKAGAELIP